MMENPLVSVIVPVYNTEEYLPRCIDSIINQTYKNLEIILIDDGSNDSSPSICDEYEKKDIRITVTHKKNGGVSSARNTGLEICSGEYFTFIDSDDYVSYSYIESLLELLLKTSADVSVCSYVETSSDLSINTDSVKTHFDVISSDKFIKQLLIGKINYGYCWGKLFSKALTEQVRFDEYGISEDVLFVYNALKQCKTVAISADKLYFYCQNPYSVMHSSNLSKHYETVTVAKRIYDDYKSTGQDITPVECFLVNHCFFCYLKYDAKDKSKEKTDCFNIIKKYRLKLIFRRCPAFKTKIACLLSFFGNKPLAFVYNLSRKG